jgi:guanylate kinase
MTGNLYVIVAPSGAGKTSLVDALLKEERGMRLSVSYTTRAPREGEVAGRNYHFVSRGEFESMLARAEFLEHAEVYGNLYGTSKRWIGEVRATGADVLLEIDWQGAAQVRKLFPDMIAIFILPPSVDTLQQRLTARGKDSPEVIARRVAGAREEMRHVDAADFIIINDDFATALGDLRAVVRATRLARAMQMARHAALISKVV